MRFLCRIGWHDWGKWESLKTIRCFENEGDSMPSSQHQVFICKCRCGMFKTKRVRI